MSIYSPYIWNTKPIQLFAYTHIRINTFLWPTGHRNQVVMKHMVIISGNDRSEVDQCRHVTETNVSTQSYSEQCLLETKEKIFVVLGGRNMYCS